MRVRPGPEEDQGASAAVEEVPVTWAMLQAGMSVIEETDEWPISYSRLEKAFQEMVRCGQQEALLGSSDP